VLSDAPVILDLHEGWAEIRLSRPDRRNAITGPLGTELAEALGTVAGRDDQRAVVLAGAGGAFCSGLDLDDFRAQPAPVWVADFPTTWRAVHRRLFECPHVIVGALERFAINGGAALALACDLLIAGEDAFLQVGEVRLGMTAPYNLAWLRLRHSEAVAARLALLGERVSARELDRLGLVHRVVEPDRVLTTARDLAASVAAHPEGAPAAIKRTLRALTATTADEWFDRATAP